MDQSLVSTSIDNDMGHGYSTNARNRHDEVTNCYIEYADTAKFDHIVCVYALHSAQKKNP